ncbi:hypothetical protein OTU49_002904 [Cherax quadricarinatus]|uniref:Uncharacterized protein n=1 Tax=Cherax quadricarinatus TaxID=27406 RepID=A0AAW0XR30_CHEQU
MPPSDQPFNPKDFLAPTARQETPRETFNGFPENFAHNLPTQEFMGDFANAEAARQDSAGFIVGKPASFPGFHSIGGFGPMDALEKGNAAGSFMEDISFPSVDIPDINEKQPQFSPQQFQKQLFP